jgi:hypothetical protein
VPPSLHIRVQPPAPSTLTSPKIEEVNKSQTVELDCSLQYPSSPSLKICATSVALAHNSLNSSASIPSAPSFASTPSSTSLPSPTRPASALFLSEVGNDSAGKPLKLGHFRECQRFDDCSRKSSRCPSYFRFPIET